MHVKSKMYLYKRKLPLLIEDELPLLLESNLYDFFGGAMLILFANFYFIYLKKNKVELCVLFAVSHMRD